jgi:predicted nucleic acid-binding protein
VELQARAKEALIAVDTSVLSLAFRRARRPTTREHPAAARLRRGIERGEPVVVPGICLQEVLSGVRTGEQFERLASLMAPFPVLLASRGHHVAAARIANACRSRGVAVAAVDALIAALALEHSARLLTTDVDFKNIARHCALRLEGY